jgi:hypothetical protein
MGRLKLILRVGGVLCFACGLLFIPLGYGISPKRDLSAFNNIVDSGAFFKTGLLLIAIGAAVYVISLLLPGEVE